MSYEKILKANPYHGKDGRFTTQAKAGRTSGGGGGAGGISMVGIDASPKMNRGYDIHAVLGLRKPK